MRPVRVGVLDTVTQAAFAWWEAGGGTPAIEAGLSASETLLELGGGGAEVLARQARFLEASGDPAGALDAWRAALGSAAPESRGWFEARLESLQILAGSDPAMAQEVARQFVTLHPKLGPPEFRPRFRALVERILGEGPP